MRRIRAALEPAPNADEELALAGRLVSSLQAGQSLDAALEAAREEAQKNGAQSGPLRARLGTLLGGSLPPSSDSLFTFLRTALDTGMPALAPLRSMEKAFRARRKLALRAVAASANARAQAEVLSWLPWAMAGAVVLVDRTWFAAATKSSLSWFLWACALLACAIGRAWIRAGIARALSPRGEAERIDELVLPDFTLRVIAEISRGIDVESATERILAAAECATLAPYFATELPAPTQVARLRSTLRHAARTGAPLREELGAFLQDLQAELESRWEERTQRLPIALLGPLFLCFLPSTLLVLLGLLAPLVLAVW